MTVFLRFSHRPPERGYSPAAFISSSALTELLAAIFYIFCNGLQLTGVSKLRSITGWKKYTNQLLPAAAEHEHLDFAPSNRVHTFQCTDLSLLATLTYCNLQLPTVGHRAHFQHTFFHSCSPVTFSMSQPCILH